MSPRAAVSALSLDRSNKSEQLSLAERIAEKIDPKAIFLKRLESDITPSDLEILKNWQNESRANKASIEFKIRQALGGVTQGDIAVRNGKIELDIDSDRSFQPSSVGKVHGFEVVADISWDYRAAKIAAPTYDTEAKLDTFMFPSKGISSTLRTCFQQNDERAQKLATAIESVNITLARTVRQFITKECADNSTLITVALASCEAINFWAERTETSAEQKQQLADLKKVVVEMVREDILESASTMLHSDKSNKEAYSQSFDFRSKATNLGKLAEITDSYDLVPSIMKAIETEASARFAGCIKEADRVAQQGEPDLFKLAFEYQLYGCAPNSEAARQAMMQGASSALQQAESKSAILRVANSDTKANLKVGNAQGLENILRSLDRFDDPNFGKVVYNPQVDSNPSLAALKYAEVMLASIPEVTPVCPIEDYFNCVRDFVRHSESRGLKMDRNWQKSFSKHLAELINSSATNYESLSKEQEKAYGRAGRRLALGAPLFSESELVWYQPGNYGQKALIFGLAMLGQTPRLSVYDCFYDLIH